MRLPVKHLVFSVIPTLALLLLAEAGLRAAGYPSARFISLFPSPKGLYPESAEIVMSFGPIPYVIKTNARGFRGPEVPATRAVDSIRIATIWDSVCDGFFVDDESTWQAYLQDDLKRAYDRSIEVLNCAHGGASIDKELWILENFVIPLQPDIVILTFVTNDISDIQGIPRSELLAFGSNRNPLVELSKAAFRWMVTGTAFGETFYHLYLSVRSPAYRHRDTSGSDLNDSRYDIEGGTSYAENSRAFERQFRDTDGILLGDSLDRDTVEAIDDYIFALTEFVAITRAQGIDLLLVFSPAYSQVYGTSSLLINNRLEKTSAQLDIDFLDLTDVFRTVGSQTVLHLAPVDFHFNPRGNELFASSVAEHLARRGLYGR